jgi:hypothetical protein
MTITRDEGYSNETCFTDIFTCAAKMCPTNQTIEDVVLGVYNEKVISISHDTATKFILHYRPTFLTMYLSDRKIPWEKMQRFARDLGAAGKKGLMEYTITGIS